MTNKTYALLAAGGSLALLLGAFAFQYIGGYPPCKLCLWQRWPHAAAIVIGALVWAFGGRVLGYLGALAALTTAGIAFYHTGVERKWWQGPTSCTGGSDGLVGLSGSDLLNVEAAQRVVMCDEVSWQLLGLSMASWNGLFSLLLALLWVMSVRRA